jgi:UDP-N-acetylglucosamine 1-carboxyvinyltransferase
LTVEGVSELKGVDYCVIPDRIEAGTYLVGALMTSGKVKVAGINASFLGAVLDKIEQAGGVLTRGDHWLQVDMLGRRPSAVDITTHPYPGFPTDMQAQFLAMNCIAEGGACVSEKIFENRFMHVQELSKMGANITVQGDNAYTLGVDELVGAAVRATDLRASASLVLAACSAKGVTTIKDIYHIDRGYAHIEKKLALLGVDIQRVAQLDCTAEFV